MAWKAGLIGNNLRNWTLAVASLGNLCLPKLLHLGTQHSVPRLFLIRLSMPPAATHQQDNSYGGSAIWRVSKFVIPLICYPSRPPDPPIHIHQKYLVFKLIYKSSDSNVNAMIKTAIMIFQNMTSGVIYCNKCGTLVISA